MTDQATEPVRAYHGTGDIDAVMREGLKADRATDASPCVWLACDPGVAAQFGVVVEVDMAGLPGSWPSGEWQAHVDYDIGPERLRRVS